LVAIGSSSNRLAAIGSSSNRLAAIKPRTVEDGKCLGTSHKRMHTTGHVHATGSPVLGRTTAAQRKWGWGWVQVDIGTTTQRTHDGPSPECVTVQDLMVYVQHACRVWPVLCCRVPPPAAVARAICAG
jgi:hypothetical protein